MFAHAANLRGWRLRHSRLTARPASPSLSRQPNRRRVMAADSDRPADDTFGPQPDPALAGALIRQPAR